MSYSIIAQPQSLSLSGNMPDIVLSANSTISFKLLIGSTTILDESYSPDAKGEIRIRIKEVVEQQLSVAIPTSNLFEQTNAVKTITANIDGTSYSYTVVKGGVDADHVDAIAFCTQNWQTWQPQSKSVKLNDPQWLSYYATQQITVKAKGYKADGTSQLIVLCTLSAGKMYSINVQYAHLLSLFTNAPSYVDIWTDNASSVRLSYIQRLILTNDYDEFDDLFVFENSLGGVDTMRMVGNMQSVNESSSLSALFDEDTIEYDAEINKYYNKNTGYFQSESYRIWADEFFTSNNRYHVCNGSIKRIVVKKSEVKGMAGDLNSASFSFAYTRQTNRLNLPRTESLPDVIELVDPAGALFFLAPRLSEFRQHTPAAGTLIPVQSPYGAEWEKMSLIDFANYLAALGGVGGGGSGHVHPDLAMLNKILINTGNYLLYAGQKIKAGYADKTGECDNATKWDNHNFVDYLDQSVKKDANVKHQSVSTPLFKAGEQGQGSMFDENGAEFDNLLVRKQMTVLELLIQKMRSVGGEMVLSPASGKCASVEDHDSFYRCFIELLGSELTHDFAVDDQVKCQTFTGKNVKYYWRRCVAIASNYIDLSKVDSDGTSIPESGDEMVTIGNRTDVSRQNAIILSANGKLRFDLHEGINAFTLVNTLKSRFGDLTEFGKSGLGIMTKSGLFQNITIGPGTSGIENFIEWAEKQTQINNAAAEAAQANNYINSVLPTTIAGLQNQIDGVVDSWFYAYTPTLTNIPASTWDTIELKERHIGDTFTNTQLYIDDNTTPDAGKSWRFVKTNGVYLWTPIADSDAVKALQRAAKAQDTADSKRRTFTAQPTNDKAYDVGDFWSNATFGTIYSNDLLKCKTAKPAGAAFDISHWELATKYTDDTVANAAITASNNAIAAATTALQSANTANSSVGNLNNYVDGAFKDGVISEAEAAAIDKLNKQINSEFDRAIADYNSVYTNTYLVGVAKTDLLNSKINLVAAKDTLQASINAAIADGKTTVAEKADVDSKFAVYKNAFTDYQAKLSNASKAVQVELDRLAGVKVDGLQVGVRNYFLNTHYDYRTYVGVTNMIANVSSLVGQQVTFSLFFNNITASYRYFEVYINDEWVYGYDVSTSAIGMQRLSKTVTVPAGANTMRFVSPNANGNCSIAMVNLVLGNKAADWTPAPEDIQAELDAVKTAATTALQSANTANNSISDQRNYIDGAFKDGVVSEAESAAIDKLNKQINSEFDRAIADYNSVYTNSYLVGAAKSDLLNSKINLVSAKDTLQTSINIAIADGKTTAAEKADVDSKFATYKNAFTDYQAKLSNAGKAVQVELDRLAGVKVDGLQVGVRNYFLNTHYDYRTYVGVTNMIANVSSLVGQQVTYSLFFNNITASYRYFEVYINDEWVYGYDVSTSAIGMQRLSKTVTVPAGANTMRFVSPDANGNCSIAMVNLVLGNKAADWTPAPEDIQAELDAVKTAAATAQADATLAKQRTEGRTVIDGGVVETNIVTLGTGGIAGMSGIPKDKDNNPLPSRWSGGTYADAIAKLATIIEWFNGDAKYGDFWIDAGGSVCIKDANGVNRVIMTRNHITTLAAIASSTQNTTVSNVENYYSSIGSISFIFPNYINVNNNNSTITINTTIVTEVGPENPAQGKGMSRVDLYLNNVITGVDILISSAIARAMNVFHRSSISVNKQFVVAAGTYRLKVVYTHTNYAYLCNFYSEVSASTTTVFFDGSTQRTEVGDNGMGIIGNALNFSSRSIENGVFKVVEKTTGVYDVPGVLAAGNIANSGANSNTYGAKVSSNTATKGGTGQYYVPHNIGNSSFTAILTPVTDSVTCRVVLKTSTQFVVYCRNASNTLVDAAFEYLLIGSNS